MAQRKDMKSANPNEQRSKQNSGPGAVTGLGGAGGSSGTGAVSAKVQEVGDLSGIAGAEPTPAPGSAGEGGKRDRQMSDGGLRGKTRGPDSETVPNQDNPGGEAGSAPTERVH